MYCDTPYIVCTVHVLNIQPVFVQASISWEFFIGALVMILAFVCITLLDKNSNWDPVWIGIRKLCTAARGIRCVCFRNGGVYFKFHFSISV